MDQLNFLELYYKNKLYGTFFIKSTDDKIKSIHYFNLYNLTNYNKTLINFLIKFIQKMKYINTLFHYVDKIKNLSVFRNLKISDPENYSIGYY